MDLHRQVSATLIIAPYDICEKLDISVINMKLDVENHQGHPSNDVVAKYQYALPIVAWRAKSATFFGVEK